MKRIRAVAILIKGNEILLMHRKKKKEYFVFPGGGVEEGETVEEAVLREIKEETTLKIRINKLLYHHIYDDGSEQYFYLCNYVKGRPKLSKESIEYERMLKKIDFYNPLWVKIKKLKDMLVYPLEIRDSVMKDFKNNFCNSAVKVSKIKISELREE